MFIKEKLAEMKKAGATPQQRTAYSSAYSGALGRGCGHKAAMVAADEHFAELTAKSRGKIKDKNFALPGKKYPIENAAHARNALARVAQNGTPEEIAKVKKAVAKKFPGIAQ